MNITLRRQNSFYVNDKIADKGRKSTKPISTKENLSIES